MSISWKRTNPYHYKEDIQSYNNIQKVSFHQWLTSCCTDPVMILYYAVPGLLGCLSSACTWHQKQFSSNRASRQHQPKHLLQKDGKYKTLLNNCVFKVSFDNLWYLLTQGSRSFIFKEAAFFSNVDSKKESRWKKNVWRKTTVEFKVAIFATFFNWFELWDQQFLVNFVFLCKILKILST